MWASCSGVEARANKTFVPLDPGGATTDVHSVASGEPWFGHDSIFPYAHVWIFKEALERTGSADRKKLGETMHKIDLKDGPARFFPDGRVKYDEVGRRVGAELCIVQWQKGRPVAVHPESIAVSKAIGSRGVGGAPAAGGRGVPPTGSGGFEAPL